MAGSAHSAAWTGWWNRDVANSTARLAADAESIVAAHLDELVALGATVIRSGVEEGTFRTVDPVAASRAVLFATSRFHHPVHAAEWADPAIDAVYGDVWRMLMDGLCVAKRPGQSSKQRRRQTP